MRKVLGRLVRRYVDVTGAPLRAMDKERRDDEQTVVKLDSHTPIDLRARNDRPEVIDLEDAAEGSNETQQR